MHQPQLFGSFFLGGFECSMHRRRDGKRLDVIAATFHDRHAAADYRQLAGHGIRAVRDGLRWHLIESAPGRYDWSSFLPMLRAARATGTQVVWDLCHYGWPNGLDIWSPSFVHRFARFAAAVARLVRDETDGVAFYAPVNEISFWAWAGGEIGFINPFARHAGDRLKLQLIRAALAAMDAVRRVDPAARFVHVEPLVNIVADPARPQAAVAAAIAHDAQFHAWDAIAGRRWPHLGGRPDYLDIIGVNYYPDNQWVFFGPRLRAGDPGHRPLRELLAAAHARFRRPILLAETGCEGEARPGWLRSVGDEVAAAMIAGVPMEGICLYPIADHPGWEDNRRCENGLLDGHAPAAGRPVCLPLADELQRQQDRFAALLAPAPVVPAPERARAAVLDREPALVMQKS